MSKKTSNEQTSMIAAKTEPQNGFTLIELMVVIVIIGILSALAVPKMFGTSSKAKAAEAPSIIAHWETLQSAYSQETNLTGSFEQIGLGDPSQSSKWFAYTDDGGGAASSTIIANPANPFGDCETTDTFESKFDAVTNVVQHDHHGNCQPAYTPNF